MVVDPNFGKKLPKKSCVRIKIEKSWNGAPWWTMLACIQDNGEVYY
jgi:hypothetical protein